MLNDSREHRHSRTLLRRKKTKERIAFVLVALMLFVFFNLPGMAVYTVLAAGVSGVPTDKTTAWIVSIIISLLVLAFFTFLTPSRGSVVLRYAVFCGALGSGILLMHMVSFKGYPTNLASMYFAHDTQLNLGHTSNAGYKPTRAEVHELQQLLQQLGYSLGASDGLLGARTKEAIRDFQRHRNLPVNTEYSPQLLDDLKRSARGVIVTEFDR